MAAYGIPETDISRMLNIDPPTMQEQMQLLAVRLEGRPIVIMPHGCKTVDEWLNRYAPSQSPA